MGAIMSSFAKFLAVLSAQKANLTTYQTQVGATVGDITQVTNMCNNMTNVDLWCQQADDYKKACFAFKQQLYDGDPLLPVPPIPVAPAAPTLTLPLSGGRTRQQALNERWHAAAGYTPVVGEALGIAGPATPPPDPDSVTPTIIVDADKSGYGFSLIVKGREQADSWTVSATVVSTGAKVVIGTGTGKSADFVYSPTPNESGPIQIRIEVQLRKNNANYGKPSAEELITVNP